MHDGMQYDPIQGQGHEPFKVGNPSIFKSYLLCHLQWELATDHVTLKLAETSLAKSRPSVSYGAIFYFYYYTGYCHHHVTAVGEVRIALLVLLGFQGTVNKNFATIWI